MKANDSRFPVLGKKRSFYRRYPASRLHPIHQERRKSFARIPSLTFIGREQPNDR